MMPYNFFRKLFFGLTLFVSCICAHGETDPNPAVVLPPVVVTAPPVGTYGFALTIRSQRSNGLIDYIKVKSTDKGSPAQLAGFKKGDQIIEIDGHPVKTLTMDVLERYLQREVGQSVTLLYTRKNQPAVSIALVAVPIPTKASKR
jgi:C-terminal processing protease CtpA/Prc